MIKISGAPFDISAIVDEYSEDSVERQVLQQMNESADEYAYDSVNTLKFELSLRDEIVNAAVVLANGRMGFSVFDESRCNHEYWDRTSNGGFWLKEGAKPNEAINDIFAHSGKYATECSTAIMMVYYKAILGVFGAELFNKQFPQIYLMDWQTEPILKDVLTVYNVSSILIGDGAYFANPDHAPEKPEWQGENAIVLPDSLYYGHGIGIATGNEIIRSLNRMRGRGATQSAHLLDTVNRLNSAKLAKIYSGVPTRVATLTWGAFPAPIDMA